MICSYISILPRFLLKKKVNYQYRNGTTFPVALRTIYADGGIPRFYRGLLPALIQGPLSRFGDTAANTGMLTLMNSMESTRALNVGVKTISASVAAALFRIFLMPVDTVKVRNGNQQENLPNKQTNKNELHGLQKRIGFRFVKPVGRPIFF